MKAHNKNADNDESAITFRREFPKLDILPEELAEFNKATAGIKRAAYENSKPDKCTI